MKEGGRLPLAGAGATDWGHASAQEVSDSGGGDIGSWELGYLEQSMSADVRCCSTDDDDEINDAAAAAVGLPLVAGGVTSSTQEV